MARSVDEWRGKSDDSRVPAAVRQRVFERYDRRCYLSGVEIRQGDAWELEHAVPLWLGGEHRETNLRPALVEAHKRKTAAEAKVRAKVNRIVRKGYGMKKKGTGFRKPPPGVRYEPGPHGLRAVKGEVR